MQELPESRPKLSILKKSTIAISTVVFIEVIIGTSVGSLAILSDGLHASLDALTGLVLFFTTRASMKPPDEEHMYGHEKFESIGGFIGGISLIVAAALIMFEAIIRIVQNKPYVNSQFAFAGFIAIAYTLSVDLYRIGTFGRFRKSNSSAMKVGLYDAIADFSSTFVALIGFGLATAGMYYGDSMASVALSIMISYLSIRLIWSSGMELTDAASEEVADKVRKEILDTKEVYSYYDLKIRKAGNKTFVRVTLQIPEFLNLEEAHDITAEAEERIRKAIGNVETSIHIEPPKNQMLTRQLVEQIATRVKGVVEAHDITAAYTRGRLYITLHVQVNPKYTVQETHEIAENIENEILGTVKDVENVTVHAEPFTAKSRKGLEVSENEISETVHKTAKVFKQAFKVRKIKTYVANKKRYINIDGYFTKQTPIEDAHTIASQIENEVQENFQDTIVTVHMEPEPPKKQTKDSKRDQKT